MLLDQVALSLIVALMTLSQFTLVVSWDIPCNQLIEKETNK